MRCFYALGHKEEREKRKKPERKIQKPFDGDDLKKGSVIDSIIVMHPLFLSFLTECAYNKNN